MSSLSLSLLCLLLSAEGADRKINIRKKRWKLIIERQIYSEMEFCKRYGAPNCLACQSER